MQMSDQRRRLYEQWVHSFAPELYRFACRLAGNRQVAEDLVQESFLEAWRSLEKQRQPDRARAWLYQILRFRFAHYLRDNRLRVASTTTLGDQPETLADAGYKPPLESLAERDALQRALDGLAPDIRETFLMVFMEGAKCREVAEALHIPIGTVLSRINRARTVLRETLRHDDSDRQTPPRTLLSEEHP